MRTLTGPILVAALAAPLVGCLTGESAPTTSPSARPASLLDEKIRCSTVGERWEKRMCEVDGKMAPFCQGWWAYHSQLDTCVGVFHNVILSPGKPNERTSRTEFLDVFDMLTHIDLEDGCVGDECDPEAAKERWIMLEVRP